MDTREDQGRANYRRRLHTVFDRLLELGNTADPMIVEDTKFLFSQMLGEMRSKEPDLISLWHLQALRRSIEHHQSVLSTLAWAAREAGASWSDVGSALGISAQAAHKRLRSYEPTDREVAAFERFTARTISAVAQAPRTR